MSTAIGVFDRSEDAERAVSELLSRGFEEQQIGLVADDRVVRGYRTTRAVVTGDRQLADDDAAGALVSVLGDDERAAAAQEILSSAGAVSVETREGEWSQWGSAESLRDSEPDEPQSEPEKPKPDPLVDLETNKGGT